MVNFKQPLHMVARELVALEVALPAIVALLAEATCRTARAAAATPRRQSRTPAP